MHSQLINKLLLTSNCFVTQKRRTHESTNRDKTQQQQNEHEVEEEGHYTVQSFLLLYYNYNCPTAIINPTRSTMTEENTTVTTRLESVEPSDDQKEIITMNDNDAYNLVGSPDSQSISADTAVSQSRNSVQTAVSLIDEEDALSDNPLYQSYSDITGSTTQLLSKSNYDIDDGVFLQPNKAYAVTNIV